MSIASLSFSAPLPVYNSIGSNGTNFAQNSIATQGNVAINTNGGSASSGKATLLTSDLSANGLSYSPTNALISGNKLTVYYDLTGNNNAYAADDQSAKNTLRAGDQGVALASGLYGSGITITPEGSQTNGTITKTAYDITLNGPVNGVLGSINHQTAYSISDSSDGTSLSIGSVTSLGNGLKITYNISDPSPVATSQPTTSPSPDTTTNTGLPASLKGVTTIGDLLANANGLSYGSTITGALQAQNGGQATGISHASNTLATLLNPSLNLSPSSSLQITDFINTSADAFPKAQTNPYTPTANSQSQASNNNQNTGSSNSTNNSNASDNNAQSVTSGSVYNSFANTGASTIRGGNLNVVA